MGKWIVFRFSKVHNWKIDTGDNWFIDCGMEENSEANAERIVKAVNSHDAMKKALKELLNGEVRTQARLKVIEALANAE